MKHLLLLACCLFLFSETAPAKTVYDVDLPEQVSIAGETLLLNGYGLRTKFFLKFTSAPFIPPAKRSARHRCWNNRGQN